MADVLQPTLRSSPRPPACYCTQCGSPLRDKPQSPLDAVDQVCGDLLVGASGHALRTKYLLDLSSAASKFRWKQIDKLILAAESTVRAVNAQLLCEESAVQVEDGPLLPESWVAAYELLDELEDPPALLVVLDAVLGKE